MNASLARINRAAVNQSRLGSYRFWNRVLLYVVLFILCVPFVTPFWWMITSSFKTYNEMFTFPPTLLPQTWIFDNYKTVFELQPFAQQYWNSFYVAVLMTLGTLICSSMAGYAFARIRFPGSNLLFVLLLTGIMMPSEVTIIPLATAVQKLGLTDSHLPLIIVPMFGSYGITATFMMRQYFLDLPSELEDAAFLDGLSRWGMFWRMALPLSKPVISAVAILTFLASWNLFLEPLVFLQTDTQYTLPLALRGYTDPYGQPMWGEQMAATTMAVAPIILFYILAQRLVVESFALSGTKG